MEHNDTIEEGTLEQNGTEVLIMTKEQNNTTEQSVIMKPSISMVIKCTSQESVPMGPSNCSNQSLTRKPSHNREQNGTIDQNVTIYHTVTTAQNYTLNLCITKDQSVNIIQNDSEQSVSQDQHSSTELKNPTELIDIMEHSCTIQHNIYTELNTNIDQSELFEESNTTEHIDSMQSITMKQNNITEKSVKMEQSNIMGESDILEQNEDMEQHDPLEQMETVKEKIDETYSFYSTNIDQSEFFEESNTTEHFDTMQSITIEQNHITDKSEKMEQSKIMGKSEILAQNEDMEQHDPLEQMETVKEESDETYSCLKCAHKFPIQADLDEHLSWHYLQEMNYPNPYVWLDRVNLFTCEYCNKGFMENYEQGSCTTSCKQCLKILSTFPQPELDVNLEWSNLGLAWHASQSQDCQSDGSDGHDPVVFPKGPQPNTSRGYCFKQRRVDINKAAKPKTATATLRTAKASFRQFPQTFATQSPAATPSPAVTPSPAATPSPASTQSPVASVANRPPCAITKGTGLINKGRTTAQDVNWEPMDTWTGKTEIFRPRTPPGPKRTFETPYDAFRAIWDDEILSLIVKKTNLYATTINRESFKEDWFETNVDEILMLFSFWMMLGVIRMPSIKSCYCDVPILRIDVFRNLLTENRYWNLNRAFCMAKDNDLSSTKLLRPMGRVMNHLNTKFQSLYTLRQDIRIDESTTSCQVTAASGRITKQKLVRLPLKIYQLRECSSGYLWSFAVFAGRKAKDADFATVFKLTRPLINSGHVLFMENVCDWLSLAQYLKRNGTDLVGTARSGSYVPLDVRNHVKLANREIVARHAGDVMVVALQEHRSRRIFISTCHGIQTTRGQGSRYKLQLVHDYDLKIGGIDPFEHPLDPYLLEKNRCKKWSNQLFKRFLNISTDNASVLLGKSTTGEVNALAFRLALVHQIFELHHSKVPHCGADPAINASCPEFPTSRLTERHFVRRIPVTAEMEKKICVWCTKQGRTNETVYECPQCLVPLCLENCFEQFHTIPEAY